MFKWLLSEWKFFVGLFFVLYCVNGVIVALDNVAWAVSVNSVAPAEASLASWELGAIASELARITRGLGAIADAIWASI